MQVRSNNAVCACAARGTGTHQSVISVKQTCNSGAASAAVIAAAKEAVDPPATITSHSTIVGGAYATDERAKDKVQPTHKVATSNV